MSWQATVPSSSGNVTFRFGKPFSLKHERNRRGDIGPVSDRARHHGRHQGQMHQSPILMPEVDGDQLILM